MSKENIKNINIKVTRDMWKEIKILGIQKDLLPSLVVVEILEKYFYTKNKKNIKNINSTENIFSTEDGA